MNVARLRLSNRRQGRVQAQAFPAGAGVRLGRSCLTRPGCDGKLVCVRLRRRLVNPLERLLVRRLGFSVVSLWLTRRERVPYVETIMLEIPGRRTGRPREVPLFVFRANDDLVVVGSNGGSSRHPSWVENLAAAPHARVRVGRRRRDVVAEVLAGDERERMWLEVVRRFPPYEWYAEQAYPREVPVIRLRPADRSAHRGCQHG